MHFNLYILTLLLALSSEIFAHPISDPETLQRRGTEKECSWQGEAGLVLACTNMKDDYSKICSWAMDKCSIIRMPQNHPCRQVRCLQNGEITMNSGGGKTDSSGKVVNILNPQASTSTSRTSSKAGPPEAGSKRKA
ncbi:hypothetical protein C8J56DRAFT_897102 [Mycena floridula]|nr:hypothetical protein C8J56DRAFT_897102 [Mycena floridula]